MSIASFSITNYTLSNNYNKIYSNDIHTNYNLSGQVTTVKDMKEGYREWRGEGRPRGRRGTRGRGEKKGVYNKTSLGGAIRYL